MIPLAFTHKAQSSLHKELISTSCLEEGARILDLGNFLVQFSNYFQGLDSKSHSNTFYSKSESSLLRKSLIRS